LHRLHRFATGSGPRVMLAGAPHVLKRRRIAD
jgi:hypothetical protein